MGPLAQRRSLACTSRCCPKSIGSVHGMGRDPGKRVTGNEEWRAGRGRDGGASEDRVGSESQRSRQARPGVERETNTTAKHSTGCDEQKADFLLIFFGRSQGRSRIRSVDRKGTVARSSQPRTRARRRTRPGVVRTRPTYAVLGRFSPTARRRETPEEDGNKHVSI